MTALESPVGLPPDQLDFKWLIYTKEDGVATVTLNRPVVYNCLNFPILREMARAFEDASWDDHVQVVVLTGAGDKAFCTGADLGEQKRFVERPHDYWKWMGVFVEAIEKLRRIGKPTIARLNGLTVGGGNEFNMACDLAIMADHAVIRHVGTQRGSVPAAGATQWLPIMAGERRAREILFLCEEIAPDQAFAWGLVNQVVPYSQLDEAVAVMAAKLKDRLPECLRYTKQQLDFWKDAAWAPTIGHARDWLTLHADSAEVKEGLDSFFARRPVDTASMHQRRWR